jgi:hypothetical protein
MQNFAVIFCFMYQVSKRNYIFHFRFLFFYLRFRRYDFRSHLGPTIVLRALYLVLHTEIFVKFSWYAKLKIGRLVFSSLLTAKKMGFGDMNICLYFLFSKLQSSVVYTYAYIWIFTALENGAETLNKWPLWIISLLFGIHFNKYGLWNR